MTKYHTTGKSSLVNTGSHSYRQGTTDAEMGREMASVEQRQREAVTPPTVAHHPAQHLNDHGELYPEVQGNIPQPSRSTNSLYSPLPYLGAADAAF